MNQLANQLHECRAGSYICFSAGNAHYALPVSHVRYITALDAISTRSAPNRNDIPRAVFDFSGETVVLYRFCEIIGTKSPADESKELIELLKARRQDHVNWVIALERSIRHNTPFAGATDPHKCAFGIWYDEYHAKDEELRWILTRFNEPHKHIHSLADTLLTLAKDPSKVDEALHILNEEKEKTLVELLDVFSEAEERLGKLARPVVLVIEGNSKVFALEVDGIRDIVDFDESNWLPHNNIEHHADICYDGFFQGLEGELFLNISPKCLLNTVNPL